MTTRPMLLISGPSGSGKSTFIEKLKAGTLHADILKSISTDSGEWCTVEANDILKGRLKVESLLENLPKDCKLVIHYDIAFIHRYGLDDYLMDNALTLLDHASPLSIIFIRPEPETLRRQFRQRRLQKQRNKSLISRAYSHCFRLPMRRLLARWKSTPTISSHRIYDTDEWILDCYKRWSSHLARYQSTHPRTVLMTVKPLDQNAGKIDFEIADPQ